MVFLRFIKFGVGDGSRIRFWHDIWCGEQPLKEAFPDFFQIASNKEAWVKDHLQMVNNVIQWNVPFSRAVQDWEVKVVMAFFAKLYAFRSHMGKSDSMRWIPSKQYLFEVKSFYHKLACLGIDVASSFPWRSIWKVKVPLRVSFLCGRRLLERL
jgi:hypothetical protein